MAVLLGEIMQIAKEAGASDVYLTAGVPPKMRVDGELVTLDGGVLTPEDVRTLILSVLVTREPQWEKFEKNGTCDFSFAIAGQGRYRVNVFKQRGSIAAAIRLVSWDIPSPESLGLPETLVKLSKKKKGLILVTGAGGSGRTNTLAAFIGAINAERSCHVITLEDPIEFLHQHNKAIVNQREIGIDVADYRTGVVDAIRENADVIMLGEVADYESIALILAAAETGRLVVSTMNTKDVVTTIERMVDVLPVEKQRQVRIQLANNLRAVVSQQLLPAIEGGAVAAFEMLTVDEAVRGMIREGRTQDIYAALERHRIKDSCTMDQAIVQLFYDGKIDRDVAVSFSYNPEKMEDII